MNLGRSTDAGVSLAAVLGDAELPTFRGTVMATLKEIRDPDATADGIAETLQYDPKLVVHLLRLVNSASMGLRNPIERAGQAVSFLGRSRLESIVLSLAVSDVLPAYRGKGFDSRRFWTAAAQRATLAKLLARELCPTLEDECFTVGLLQDMAIPLLASAHPAQYGEVLDTWHAEPDLNLSEVEQSAFGWAHGEIGHLVGAHWELPETLARGIGAHHGPPDEALPAAMHLVSFVRETAPEAGIEALIAEAESRYDLPADTTIEAVILACDRASELAELFC